MIKTRTEARIHVYTKIVAHSLRRRAEILRAKDISDAPLTDAQVNRVKLEMVRLAEQLEAKASKLQAREMMS